MQKRASQHSSATIAARHFLNSSLDGYKVVYGEGAVMAGGKTENGVFKPKVCDSGGCNRAIGAKRVGNSRSVPARVVKRHDRVAHFHDMLQPNRLYESAKNRSIWVKEYSPIH